MKNLKTYEQFLSEANAADMKNQLNLKMDTDNPPPSNPKEDQKIDQKIKKNLNLKTTEIKNKVNRNIQNKQITDKNLKRMEDEQRELVPEDPVQKKQFLDDKKTEINIENNKLTNMDQENKFLQQQIAKKQKMFKTGI